MGVKNSEELRKAHDSMQPAIVSTYQEIGQSEALYKAYAALKENAGLWNQLEETQQRIVIKALQQMENSGVSLPPEKRARFTTLQLELAELTTKFSNNVLDATKAFQLVVTDKAELDGLPQSVLNQAAQTAERLGHTTKANAETGPWVLTLDLPVYLPCMQHLKNRVVREKLYRGYVTRASTHSESSAQFDNAPILRRILQIKYDLAQLLGYNSHAERSLSSKMASSVDQVLQLTTMLREAAYPAAQQELQAVKDFAKEKYQVDFDLALWDLPYYGERYKEAQYQFEEEALRVYFALPKVLEGLFTLAERLFSVKIVAKPVITPNSTETNIPANAVEVWHEDVQYFSVLDAKTNQEIAGFYLDPYARAGEKRGGAWMDVCLGRSKVLGTLPVAYLVCNGSPPVKEKQQPSLMSFREVETLFHEFGHGLQHMLTTVQDADAAGSKLRVFFF
jgi:oligopeptidase A